MTNTEIAGQEAQQPPPLPCLVPGPDSNYSATCQLKNNRSRIPQLTGWWGYFCLAIFQIISFQISAGFHLFIHYLAVSRMPAWHFLRMAPRHWACMFLFFIQAHYRFFPGKPQSLLPLPYLSCDLIRPWAKPGCFLMPLTPAGPGCSLYI